MIDDELRIRTTSDDMARIRSLRARLKAASHVETIRRAVITVSELLDAQERGCDIVLCKKGLPDKVVWFV